jgi:hypothetical protein
MDAKERRNLFKSQRHLYKIAFDSNSNGSLKSSTSVEHGLNKDLYLNNSSNVSNQLNKGGYLSDDLWTECSNKFKIKGKNDKLQQSKLDFRKTAIKKYSKHSSIDISSDTESFITEDEILVGPQREPSSFRFKLLNDVLERRKLSSVETYKIQYNLDLVSKAKISDMAIKCLMQKK